MGLLQQEIFELRQLNQRLSAGDLKPGQINAHVAIYSQIEKRARLMFQAAALGAKFGQSSVKNLSKSKLIDDSVIDINIDPVLDKIMCPAVEKVITRGECKKYSEKTGNLRSCQECHNFTTTRKLLKNNET